MPAADAGEACCRAADAGSRGGDSSSGLREMRAGSGAASSSRANRSSVERFGAGGAFVMNGAGNCGRLWTSGGSVIVLEAMASRCSRETSATRLIAASRSGVLAAGGSSVSAGAVKFGRLRGVSVAGDAPGSAWSSSGNSPAGAGELEPGESANGVARAAPGTRPSAARAEAPRTEESTRPGGGLVVCSPRDHPTKRSPAEMGQARYPGHAGRKMT